MLGVFDSGLGGVGVADAIRRLDPTVDLVVLADQARAPYGDRPPSDVRRFVDAATNRLTEQGCSTIVIACNTASTVALAELRSTRTDLLFVGMEPAVKPAVARSGSGVVAVAGTTTTIGGRLLAEVVARFAGSTQILGLPLPGLVELIEGGLEDAPEVESLLAPRWEPARRAGADVLVLACTHYGFARAAIQRVVGPRVVVIDPAEAVARQALRVHGSGGSGMTELLTTGDGERLRAQAARLVGWDVPVRSVALDVPTAPTVSAPAAP